MNLTTLLISLALGAMLVSGGYELLATAQNRQHRLEQKIDTAEAIQQARLLLTKARQNAVVSLCGPGFHWQGVVNNTQIYQARTALTPVQVLQPDNSLIQQWDLNKAGDAKISATSPVLVTRTVDQTTWLSAPLLQDSDNITVPRSLAFKANQFLTLQDCRYLLIDKITKVKKANGADVIILQHVLPLEFAHGAMVGHFEFRAYYLSKTGLYVQTGQGRRYELVPDVTLGEVSAWLR